MYRIGVSHDSRDFVIVTDAGLIFVMFRFTNFPFVDYRILGFGDYLPFGLGILGHADTLQIIHNSSWRRLTWPIGHVLPGEHLTPIEHGLPGRRVLFDNRSAQPRCLIAKNPCWEAEELEIWSLCRCRW